MKQEQYEVIDVTTILFVLSLIAIAASFIWHHNDTKKWCEEKEYYCSRYNIADIVARDGVDCIYEWEPSQGFLSSGRERYNCGSSGIVYPTCVSWSSYSRKDANDTFTRDRCN